jgi:hypothetical protein
MFGQFSFKCPCCGADLLSSRGVVLGECSCIESRQAAVLERERVRQFNQKRQEMLAESKRKRRGAR